MLCVPGVQKKGIGWGASAIVVMSFLRWMLGPELGTSGRTSSALSAELFLQSLSVSPPDSSIPVEMFT